MGHGCMNISDWHVCDLGVHFVMCSEFTKLFIHITKQELEVKTILALKEKYINSILITSFLIKECDFLHKVYVNSEPQELVISS